MLNTLLSNSTSEDYAQYDCLDSTNNNNKITHYKVSVFLKDAKLNCKEKEHRTTIIDRSDFITHINENLFTDMFIGNCYVTIRAHKTAVVEIFDLAGRLVTSSKYLPGGNNNKIALKLTNLPNGLYIFYIKMDQQVLSKKVLVVLLL